MTIRIDGANTAANPGITGSDTDTGLQFGTDEVNIVTGGSTAVTVDSSQRVGIGVTSPANNLHVNAANATFDLQDSGATNSIGRFINASGSLYIQSQNNTSHGNIVLRTSNGSSALERARIDSSGRLGIGTSSPNALLHLAGNNGIEFGAGGNPRGEINYTAAGDEFLDIACRGTNSTVGNVRILTGNVSSAAVERLRVNNFGAFGLSGANYGSSGQVLTSNGSGSAPQWATPSAGFTAGSGVTLGGNATATFSGIPSSARQIIITLNFAGPPASQEQSWMALRVGTSAGWISSNIYAWNTSGGTSVNRSSGTSYIQISGSWNNASNARDHGTIILNQTDNHSWTTMSLIGDVARGDSICQGAGRIATTNIGVNLDRVLLFTTSGNAWATGEAAIQYI